MPDEDGEPITSMVVDWTPAGASGEAKSAPDPWEQHRRQDQRTALLRLRRVLMAELAEHGVELPIPPDGPTIRMIDQEIVREAILRLHTGGRHHGAEGEIPASEVCPGARYRRGRATDRRRRYWRHHVRLADPPRTPG